MNQWIYHNFIDFMMFVQQLPMFTGSIPWSLSNSRLAPINQSFCGLFAIKRMPLQGHHTPFLSVEKLFWIQTGSNSTETEFFRWFLFIHDLNTIKYIVQKSHFLVFSKKATMYIGRLPDVVGMWANSKLGSHKLINNLQIYFHTE